MEGFLTEQKGAEIYILNQRLSVAPPVFKTPCLRTAYCSLPLRTALAQPHEPPRGTSPCGSCADATMIERDCDGASWGSSMTFAPRRCRERCAWCSTSDATKSQRRCRAVAQVHCASPRPPPPTHPLLLSIISLSSPRRVRRAHNGGNGRRDGGGRRPDADADADADVRRVRRRRRKTNTPPPPQQPSPSPPSNRRGHRAHCSSTAACCRRRHLEPPPPMPTPMRPPLTSLTGVDVVVCNASR